LAEITSQSFAFYRAYSKNTMSGSTTIAHVT